MINFLEEALRKLNPKQFIKSEPSSENFHLRSLVSEVLFVPNGVNPISIVALVAIKDSYYLKVSPSLHLQFFGPLLLNV